MDLESIWYGTKRSYMMDLKEEADICKFIEITEDNETAKENKCIPN